MSNLGNSIRWSSYVKNYLSKVGIKYVTNPSSSKISHIRGPKNKTVCQIDLSENVTYVDKIPSRVCKLCISGLIQNVLKN